MLVDCMVLSSSSKESNKKRDRNRPYCRKANVPFTCESEAFQQAKSMVNCIYNYWLLDDKYDGSKGFERMWGKNEYFFNESSIVDFDGTRIEGYGQWRKKAVVSQSLITVPKCKSGTDDPRKNMVLLNWSSYSISFNFQVNVKLDLPEYYDSINKIQRVIMENTFRFFEDESGIIKYQSTNSTEGVTGMILGIVTSTMIDTTQALADVFGYIDEDKGNTDDNYMYNYFGISPIMLIFMVIVSIFASLVGFGCILLVKCLSFTSPDKTKQILH